MYKWNIDIRWGRPDNVCYVMDYLAGLDFVNQLHWHPQIIGYTLSNETYRIFVEFGNLDGNYV